MKIGLLAYHSACNFGATLQLLSTYEYLRGKGHEPIIINWTPNDLEAFYRRTTPASQYEYQQTLRGDLWNETERATDAEAVARVIEAEGIEAVIVGSDAVAQHHPWQERVVFPTRRLFTVVQYTSDRMFPNPFWGTFNNYLEQPRPVSIMSASSQDSAYMHITGKMKDAMNAAVSQYNYVSVRDTWTSDMFSHITDGELIPPVTPDPVFAFNQNAGHLVAERKDILHRFHLNEKYVLLSFFAGSHVTQEWIDEFVKVAHADDCQCVILPFAQRPSLGTADVVVEHPLSPLDWYALIRYSAGYVGNNMHPIVVALTNNVPFFSFDNYGKKRLFRRTPTDKSSKIRHILLQADLMEQRVSCIAPSFVPPSPTQVYTQLRSIDLQKEASFAQSYLAEYNEMMSQIMTHGLSLSN